MSLAMSILRIPVLRQERGAPRGRQDQEGATEFLHG